MTLRPWLLPIVAATQLLVACQTPAPTATASVQLATNNRLSEAVRAKSFKSYREILFVPPADDRRNVAPRIAEGSARSDMRCDENRGGRSSRRKAAARHRPPRVAANRGARRRQRTRG